MSIKDSFEIQRQKQVESEKMGKKPYCFKYFLILIKKDKNEDNIHLRKFKNFLIRRKMKLKI